MKHQSVNPSLPLTVTSGERAIKGKLTSSAPPTPTIRPLESKPSEQAQLSTAQRSTLVGNKKKKSSLHQHPKLVYFLISLTGGNGSLSASPRSRRLGRPITAILNQFSTHGTKVRSLKWAEVSSPKDSQSLADNPKLVKSPKLKKMS